MVKSEDWGVAVIKSTPSADSNRCHAPWGMTTSAPASQRESLRMTIAGNMECGRSVDDLNDLIALRVPLPFPAAGKLGDKNGAVPVRHETR